MWRSHWREEGSERGNGKEKAIWIFLIILILPIDNVRRMIGADMQVRSILLYSLALLAGCLLVAVLVYLIEKNLQSIRQNLRGCLITIPVLGLGILILKTRYVSRHDPFGIDFSWVEFLRWSIVILVAVAALGEGSIAFRKYQARKRTSRGNCSSRR